MSSRDITFAVDNVTKVFRIKKSDDLDLSKGSGGIPHCEAYRCSRDVVTSLDDLQQRIIDLSSDGNNYDSEEVVKLNKVSIRYGDRTILKELDWTVRRGEKWALSGENGAGKSTLLSLVCADNPQSYACDISLFGRKRGTGESIWEIKKHIGYVSPEMHRAYLKNLPAIEIVASGLHDSIGLYKRPQPEQMAICEWWMDIFGIADLKDKPFLQLSSGEQRLSLLARAFVKDPELPELTFTSDKNRLYQVLLNFVTNALKFTSEGSIVIDYRINGNEVRFSVQDTGMGIEPEKQEAIFTRFVKLNNFIAGTGLGLEAVKDTLAENLRVLLIISGD